MNPLVLIHNILSCLLVDMSVWFSTKEKKNVKGINLHDAHNLLHRNPTSFRRCDVFFSPLCSVWDIIFGYFPSSSELRARLNLRELSLSLLIYLSLRWAITLLLKEHMNMSNSCRFQWANKTKKNILKEACVHG